MNKVERGGCKVVRRGQRAVYFLVERLTEVGK